MVRARNVNKTKADYKTSDWEQEEFRSRTDIKKAAQAVTDLGEHLSQLPEGTLKRMNLPQQLLEALMLLKRTDKGPAIKRQKKYIGSYLRNNEALLVEIKQFLQAEALKSKQFSAQLEQWRDRLIEQGDEAINALIEAYPDKEVDRTQLRQWIRNAKKEQQQHLDSAGDDDEANSPASVAASKSGKSTKAIFQYLKTLLK